MPGNGIEEKLKFLCYLIISYSNNKQVFGLHLDLSNRVIDKSEVKIEPSTGDKHQQNCLIALANVNSITYEH